MIRNACLPESYNVTHKLFAEFFAARTLSWLYSQFIPLAVLFILKSDPGGRVHEPVSTWTWCRIYRISCGLGVLATLIPVTGHVDICWVYGICCQTIVACKKLVVCYSPALKLLLVFNETARFRCFVFNEFSPIYIVLIILWGKPEKSMTLF